MFYNVYSIFSFNEIDYLTYINLWMLFLYYWIITFFVVIVSSLLIRSSVSFVNDSWLEFILTLFSLWLVLLIISPLFIMFIDYDSILLSSLLVYSLGYQWSWSFNLNGVFTYSLSDNYSSFVKNGIVQSFFNSFIYSGSAVSSLSGLVTLPSDSFEYVLINVSFDHFLVPTLSLLDLSFFLNPGNYGGYNFCSLNNSVMVDYLVYFISLNSILLLPCFLGFRFLIFSFDVIHSLGFYSLGFKMDAIPGRINYSFELSTLFKGEHRGFCYELCGTSHSSMLILAVSL